MSANKTGEETIDDCTVIRKRIGTRLISARVFGVPIILLGNLNQLQGAVFPVEVQVGREGNPVANFFGLSFKMDYTNTAIIDALEVDTIDSFLGTRTDIIPFRDIDDENGVVSIAITRKAGMGGVDGYGIVARVKFKIADDAPIGEQSTLSLRDVTANDPEGVSIELAPTPPSITIRVIEVSVWPGDTNKDGTVDERDILRIGQYFCLTGPPREPPSTEWAD